MFCWLLASNSIYSQQDTLKMPADTVAVKKKAKKKKALSPDKATFFSAVLPGMGQIYNRKYWKLPILYGGIAGLGYAIGFNTKYYRKYKAAFRDFIIQDPNNKSYLELLPPSIKEEDLNDPQIASWFQNALDNKKNYYRRYRDLSFIGMTLLYVLNLMDASVDAHLSTFNISDDLSLRVDPVLMDPYPSVYSKSGGGVKLSIKF